MYSDTVISLILVRSIQNRGDTRSQERASSPSLQFSVLKNLFAF